MAWALANLGLELTLLREMVCFVQITWEKSPINIVTYGLVILGSTIWDSKIRWYPSVSYLQVSSSNEMSAHLT